MSGLRVALPVGGNPAAASALINFQLADGAGAGVPNQILGWSVTEAAGAAAKIRFHDGAGAGSQELGPMIVLAANGGTGPQMFTTGIQCQSGKVFLEVISGSVEVSVYW